MPKEERILSELKDLNKNYHDLGVSNARGEEQLKGIHKQFKELNGSVKTHEVRIGKIEKSIYLILGGAGMLTLLWNVYTTLT